MLSRWTILRRTFCSQQSKLDLSGIFPPITTPFKENGAIYYDKLEGNLLKWSRIPFKGLVVQGSNGEYAYLSPDERVDLVNFVRPRTRKLLLAGAGCESTRLTIEMCQRMSDKGADGLLIINPSFYKSGMTDYALRCHFEEVADASPKPILIYNVPANTALEIPVETVTHLSSHPNIIGLKDSGGDIVRLTLLRHLIKDDSFQMLAGSASFLYPSYKIGAVGGICALANVLGPDLCRLHELTVAADDPAALQLQRRLITPNTCVTRSYGVAGLKLAMDWFGLYGGLCRKPLQSLDEKDARQMRRLFRLSGYEDFGR